MLYSVQDYYTFLYGVFMINDHNIGNEDQERAEQGAMNELATCKQERDSWKDKFLYLQADFDNVTKRNIKERAQWSITAQTSVLSDLLPVIDDFDRAFAEIEKKEVSPDVKTWLTGFQLIHKTLQKMLAKYEVVEISAAIPFDPSYHEAIVQVEAPGHESGAIVEVLQKGYTCKGTVLRPAKVSVAK